MKKMGRLYILMLNIFIAMLGFGLIVPVMPSYIEAFGATGKTLGFLVAATGPHTICFITRRWSAD